MKSPLPLLLVSVFISIAGFSLILPLLPFYGKSLDATPVQIAMLFAAYSLGNIVGEMYWGRLSDRIGRKKVLVMAMSGAAIFYVAFAFAPTYGSAVLIRIAGGVFGGILGVCQSFIADITPPEQRARNMGYFGAAFNLGFALGPSFGLLVNQSAGAAGFRVPILTAAVLAALSAVWSALALRETRVAGGPVRDMPKWSEAMTFVAGNPLLVRLFAIGFCGIAVFSSMEAIYGLWTAHNFGWNERQLGLVFIVFGGTGVLVQWFLIGPLVGKFGEARVIVGGLGVLILSVLLQPILRSPLTAVLLMGLMMAGHSLTFPNAGSLISRYAPRERLGSVMGLMMAINALSRIIAPPLFGAVYSMVSPDAPYYVCAVLVSAVVLIALSVIRLQESPA